MRGIEYNLCSKEVAMTYLDKYPGCNGCPVEEYCGTAVSCIKLCHSINDSAIHNLKETVK